MDAPQFRCRLVIGHFEKSDAYFWYNAPFGLLFIEILNCEIVSSLLGGADEVSSFEHLKTYE